MGRRLGGREGEEKEEREDGIGEERWGKGRKMFQGH